MVVRPSIVASSSRVLAELVPFGTLRCSSRTTLRIIQYVPCTPNWDLASRYSSWSKLLRTTDYLYRFLNRLRRSKNLQANTATLLHEEIQNAKRYWLKIMQSIMFLNKIAALRHKRLVSKNSPLYVLNPYRDENGLVRIQGRLRRAYLLGAMRNSIVLHAHPLLVLISTIFERCMPILN